MGDRQHGHVRAMGCKGMRHGHDIPGCGMLRWAWYAGAIGVGGRAVGACVEAWAHRNWRGLTAACARTGGRQGGVHSVGH